MKELDLIRTELRAMKTNIVWLQGFLNVLPVPAREARGVVAELRINMERIFYCVDEMQKVAVGNMQVFYLSTLEDPEEFDRRALGFPSHNDYARGDVPCDNCAEQGDCAHCHYMP